ncbi:MAG: hypothetical protein GOU97_04835 [Nanoarchaeota archaeon]|nr:hypothetical protein [Nanoarchaeota archaeon]
MIPEPGTITLEQALRLDNPSLVIVHPFYKQYLPDEFRFCKANIVPSYEPRMKKLVQEFKGDITLLEDYRFTERTGRELGIPMGNIVQTIKNDSFPKHIEEGQMFEKIFRTQPEQILLAGGYWGKKIINEKMNMIAGCLTGIYIDLFEQKPELNYYLVEGCFFE